MVAKQKKESIHATVSPYIKRQAEDLLATEDFSSMSDLVSIALAEFIGAYNRRQKEKEGAENTASLSSDNPVVIEEIIE